MPSETVDELANDPQGEGQDGASGSVDDSTEQQTDTSATGADGTGDTTSEVDYSALAAQLDAQEQAATRQQTPPNQQTGQPPAGTKPEGNTPAPVVLSDEELEAIADDLGVSTKAAKKLFDTFEKVMAGHLSAKLGHYIEVGDDFKAMRAAFAMHQQQSQQQRRASVIKFFDEADKSYKGVFGTGQNRTPSQIAAAKAVYDQAVKYQQINPNLSDEDALKVALAKFSQTLPGASKLPQAQRRAQQVTTPTPTRGGGSGRGGDDHLAQARAGVRSVLEKARKG